MKGKDNDKLAPEPIEIPDTVDLAAVNEAEIAVIRLAAGRKLDLRDAYRVSRMLEHRRRALGDVVLEERMKALEATDRAKRGQQP